MELTVWHNIYLKMISWQTAAHWPYVEAPFPFYLVTEGWLEIDKHYSLELCFSIEKQPETVWRGGCLA